MDTNDAFLTGPSSGTCPTRKKNTRTHKTASTDVRTSGTTIYMIIFANPSLCLPVLPDQTTIKTDKDYDVIVRNISVFTFPGIVPQPC